MLDRILGVIKLDAATYQEIDQDDSATGQAVLVAIAAALIGGLSGFFGTTTVLGEVVEQSVGGWLTSAIIGTPIGLAIGTGILLLLGKMFKGQAEYMGLFRSLGFATAPTALGFIPVIGALASLWTAVCAVVAVRESHGISTGQAVITVLVPLIVLGILAVLIAVLIGFALFGALGGLAD